MARRHIGLAAGIAALVSGCSLAPDYHPVVTATPATFKEAGPWAVALPGNLAPRGAWWSIFADPGLDALERQLDAGNPGLALAVARYDAARAYLSIARADLSPQVGLGASLTRNRQSEDRPLRGSTQPNLYGADTISGSASYELDLWGRVRNSVAAGRAEAEASADDVAAVRLSLEAELASAYLLLRGQDEQIAMLSATVDAFAEADATTRRRFAGGIASGIDTGRSGALLAEAQAQLAEAHNGRALAEHAIASLVGTPASGFALAPAPTGLALPVVPTGVPSTLLQRRPDVAAAERRMAAANARIGVARAAFYPQISLGGQGGFQGTGLPGLLSAPNIFWSIGPDAVLNLFDGGRRRAQLAVARANWDAATADYRGGVLQAFREVEDSLAQLHYLGDETAAEQRAVDQATQAEQLSLNRYIKGASSYLDVVTAQTTALRVRQTAISLRTRQLQASVGLVRALGGGWPGAAPALAGNVESRPGG